MYLQLSLLPNPTSPSNRPAVASPTPSMTPYLIKSTDFLLQVYPIILALTPAGIPWEATSQV